MPNQETRARKKKRAERERAERERAERERAEQEGPEREFAEYIRFLRIRRNVFTLAEKNMPGFIKYHDASLTPKDSLLHILMRKPIIDDPEGWILDLDDRVANNVMIYSILYEDEYDAKPENMDKFKECIREITITQVLINGI